MRFNNIKGFTLAEVLITLGIIGIISAITIPAVLHSKPDANKATYLKLYDTLTKNITELASDSSKYQMCGTVANVNDVDCHQYPLLNQSRPVGVLNNNETFIGEQKFCNLLADKLGATNISCGTNNNYADNTFTANKSFDTPNGMQWMIYRPVDTSLIEGNATWQRDVYVDINGNSGNNCIYNAATCNSPDRYKFIVFANGSIIPADIMGQHYINTRRSFSGKKQPEANLAMRLGNEAGNNYPGQRNLTEVSLCVPQIRREITLTIGINNIEGQDKKRASLTVDNATAGYDIKDFIRNGDFTIVDTDSETCSANGGTIPGTRTEDISYIYYTLNGENIQRTINLETDDGILTEHTETITRNSGNFSDTIVINYKDNSTSYNGQGGESDDDSFGCNYYDSYSTACFTIDLYNDSFTVKSSSSERFLLHNIEFTNPIPGNEYVFRTIENQWYSDGSSSNLNVKRGQYPSYKIELYFENDATGANGDEYYMQIDYNSGNSHEIYQKSYSDGKKFVVVLFNGIQ